MKPYERINPKFCIYIKKDYVELFKILKRSKGSYDNAILYLITKYRYRFNALNTTVYKSSKIYQPHQEDYVRYGFRLEKEAIWGELNQLKEITGMSISLLIRIMLEWEFLVNGIHQVMQTIQLAGGRYPLVMRQMWFWMWEGWMRRLMGGIIISGIEFSLLIHHPTNSFHIRHKFYYRRI